MHKTRSAAPRFLIAIAAAGLIIAQGSAAADDKPAVEDAPHTITSKILTRAIEPDYPRRWLEAEFYPYNARGFEYNRSMAFSAKKKITFSIQGPMIMKRTPGLIFEIRF